MLNFNRLEPVNPQVFHIDWEITLKCNLDCGYCGSHDNSKKHPPLQECLDTVDFLLEYADINFIDSALEHRKVIFNLFGGEAIYHPNFIEIVEYLRSEYNLKYKHKWELALGLITNAIASDKNWARTIELIDAFTISYHAENNEKQEQQFRKNVLALHQKTTTYHVAVLMNAPLFHKNLSFIEFCKEHGIKYLPRQLDHWGWDTRKYNYTEEQVQWFEGMYKRKSTKPLPSIKIENITKPKVKLIDKVKGIFKKIVNYRINMTKIGRACCGGETLCVDGKFDEKVFFVPNNRFKDWHCSVNRFFVFVKQDDQSIRHNKDCRMRFDGREGPMGYLKDSREILDKMREEITLGTRPVIVCKKKMCFCGLCAPKAKTLDTYTTMMTRYIKNVK